MTTASEHFYNACKCCLSIFYNSKASLHKQRQLSWFSLSLFYFFSIIYAFVTYCNVFYRRIRYDENLFISLRVLSESSKTCYFRTVFSYTSVVNNGLHEPYLLLPNSSFTLLLSESHRGCLIWVKFVKISKRKFKSQLNVIDLCSQSLIKHAVSANQSARYMETSL